MASNNTEARRIMYKAAARVTDRGRRRRHDNIEENRKIRRKQILQKKRREDLTASTSSATNQPLLDFSSWSLEKKLESLPQMVAGVNSGDPYLQLQATVRFRELLSIEGNPPINQVIQSGVIPRIVQLLSRAEFPILQCEAAVVLTIILDSGTPENIQVIIDNAAVPLFVQLLRSDRMDVREKAVYAFSNITSRCSNDQIRFLASQGCLDPLNALLVCPDLRVSRVISDLLEKIENLQSPQKVDSDDPIFTKYIGPPIDRNDERYEPLLHPRKLSLENLSLGTKKSDIISFFKRTASISLKISQVRVLPVDKGEKTRTFVITLSDVAETRRAWGMMHGELVRTRHIFVTRQMGYRRSVYVSGFSKGLGKDGTKKELQEIFQGHATITSIYLPNDEFGYILVGKCDKHFYKALGKGSFRNGEAVITIRDAFMLPQILDEFSP